MMVLSDGMKGQCQWEWAWHRDQGPITVSGSGIRTRALLLSVGVGVASGPYYCQWAWHRDQGPITVSGRGIGTGALLLSVGVASGPYYCQWEWHRDKDPINVVPLSTYSPNTTATMVAYEQYDHGTPHCATRALTQTPVAVSDSRRPPDLWKPIISCRGRLAWSLSASPSRHDPSASLVVSVMRQLMEALANSPNLRHKLLLN